MSTAEQVPPIRDVDEFLAWEERQDARYEFVDGVIRMMTGGTMLHNWLCQMLSGALNQRLPPHCRAFTENVKLQVANNVLYPDVLVTCDTGNLQASTTARALLAAEVLSPSTPKREIDRKQRAYLAAPGLQHYLVISQDMLRVEVFTPFAGGGSRHDVFEWAEDAVAVPGIGFAIPMQDIYHRSGLLPEESAP